MRIVDCDPRGRVQHAALIVDAEATPPALASATLLLPDGSLITCDSGALLDAPFAESPA